MGISSLRRHHAARAGQPRPPSLPAMVPLDQVRELMRPLRERIAELEAEVVALRAPVAVAATIEQVESVDDAPDGERPRRGRR